MKIILTITFLIFNIGSLFAQLTIGEVFNFNIGDEFHFESNRNGPTWIERKKIIGKSTDENETIVTYKWQNDISGLDPNTLKIFDTTIYFETSYQNLDSSILTLEIGEFLNGKNSKDVTFLTKSSYLDSFSNTLYVIDTTLKYDTLVCGTPTNAVVKRTGENPQLIRRQYFAYGKGLGLIYSRDWDSDDIEDEFDIFTEIFFYKKNDKTCGIPDNTSIDPLKTLRFEIYPNPAQEKVNLKGVENGNYKIIDMKGQIVQTGKFYRSIEISRLIEGNYLLEIELDGVTFGQKIIKSRK